MNSLKTFFSKPWLSVVFLVCLLLTLVVVNRQRGNISNLEDSVMEYEEKLSDIRNHVDELESSVDGLRGAVDNFENENWRDVVPEVESATGSVVSEFEDLKSATD
jgi:hypothetical protein